MRKPTRTGTDGRDWRLIQVDLVRTWPHVAKRLEPGHAGHAEGKPRGRGRPAFADRRAIFEAFLWALFTGRSLRWMHGEVAGYPPGVTVHRALARWTDDESLDGFVKAWRTYLVGSKPAVRVAWRRMFEGQGATSMDSRHATQRRRLHWFCVMRDVARKGG